MPKLPRLLNVNYDEDRPSEPVLIESPPKDSLPPANMDEIDEKKKRLAEMNGAFNEKMQKENERLQEKIQKLNDLAEEIVKLFYIGD